MSEEGNILVNIKASDLPDREMDYAYIIRAIKSHDALLKACKLVLDNLRPLYSSEHICIKSLEAAIALAEKGAT